MSEQLLVLLTTGIVEDTYSNTSCDETSPSLSPSSSYSHHHHYHHLLPLVVLDISGQIDKLDRVQLQ